LKRYKLMIPGPVDVPDEVLQAMIARSLPHYGDDWMEIYGETLQALHKVFGTQGDLFIMPGPGSAASEAALNSMLAPGEKVLLPVSGFFSERLGRIARACGSEVIVLETTWGEPVQPERVAEALERDHEIKAVALIHHETSTGVLNPLREIAQVTHEHGLPIIVDGISSIGGVPLPVDEWGIEVCISVANKCLEAAPGLGMISVNERAWQVMDAKKDKIHGWYLNLNVWREYSHDWDWHPYPTTVPTHLIMGLHASLQGILAEGLEARYARYQRTADKVRAGLREMGFEMLVAPEYACPLITAMKGRPGVALDALSRFLRDEHGILVAGGIGPLRGQILRVGHMGRALTDEYSQAFLTAVEDFLKRNPS